jgi:hypothetical protein
MCLFLQYADWCTHISLTLSENQELFWDTAMRMTRSIESWSLKWRRHSIKNRQKYNAYRCDVLKRKVKWESSLKHKNGCKAHLGVMLVEISETLCWWFSYSVQAPSHSWCALLLLVVVFLTILEFELRLHISWASALPLEQSPMTLLL